MATATTGGPIVDPKPEPKPDVKGKATEQAKAPGAGATGAGGSDAPKKLSAAELKAKKQAEKAARRAHAIAVKTATAAAADAAVQGPAAQATQGPSESKSAKTKAKQDGQPSASSASAGRSGPGGKQPAAGHRTVPVVAAKEKDGRQPTTPCFAHLPEAKRIPLLQADKDVHPVVLALGQQMASFAMYENIARLKATLDAFKEVMQSYEAPSGNAFSRHFVPQVLNPQIEYLTECRPMCYAMGNAIRLLKTRVSDLDIDTTDEQACDTLCRVIDAFVEEKIHYAEVIITNNAAAMIVEGDTVFTYGHQRLVRKAIRLAHSEGRTFKVVIVEDHGARKGRELAKLLRDDGLAVTYFPELVEVRNVLGKGTKVMLGVEAVFANGALYAPAGTSDIAAAASALELPVIALSESINVDRDRVAADSLTYNEIDPEKSTPLGSRLLFDTTKPQHVMVLVTEYETVTGNAPAAAVLAILRKQDEPN